MGWGYEEWRIAVSLDEHAGDREREDAALWAELRARLREVCSDPRYARILVTDLSDDA